MFSNKKNEIFRYIYNDEDSLRQAFIIPGIDRFKINKIFSDHKGNHSIISLQLFQSKTNFYFNHKLNKFKECNRMKDLIIEEISWDENTSEFSTNVYYYV